MSGDRKKTDNFSKKHIRETRRKLLSVLLSLLLFTFMWTCYATVISGHVEWPTFSRKTNAGPLISNRQVSRMLHHFPIFNEIWFDSVAEDTYIIPGLKSTRTLKSDQSRRSSICTSMTPQGVCAAGRYLLISAYCHTQRHNSVIYVMDLKSHGFIKEIVLPGRPHVGSIAYDSRHENIWVACYTDNRAAVSAFSMTQLEGYHLSSDRKPVSYEMEYPILSQERASFMTCHDGSLYVGYFTKKADDDTNVQRFLIGEDGGLLTYRNGDPETNLLLPSIALPTDIIQISAQCQGMAFSDSYVLFSQSSGPYKSTVYAHKAQIRNGRMDARNSNSLFYFTLPSMLEQIFSDEKGSLYLIFESAAASYRSWPILTLDRVVVLQMNAAAPSSADSELAGKRGRIGSDAEGETDIGLIQAIWRTLHGESIGDDY